MSGKGPSGHVFESLFKRYSLPKYLSSDPVEYALRCRTEADKEIGALIAALFAYGNVKAMRSFLGLLFGALGGEDPGGRFQPAAFLRESPSVLKSKGLASRRDLYYRFQSQNDVLQFAAALQLLVKEGKGGLCLEGHAGELTWSLDRRIDALAASILSRVPVAARTRGLLHLVGGQSDDTGSGGLRKRYCMFLRWMVRDGFPDLGLYKSFRAADLVAPVDVHLMRMARNLGWIKAKTSTWKTALDITSCLKFLSPEDPLKYDFALTRLGILKECRSEYIPDLCEGCDLRGVCGIYARSRGT